MKVFGITLLVDLR